MTSVTPPRTPGFAAPDEGLPVGWNDSAAPFEADATIDEVVDARATERPDAPAIVEGERTLTYGELEERASTVAAALGEYLDAPDQTVGVLAPRSIDAVVAFYGVMKAGAAFVPLEAELPDERLAFLAEDAGVRAIVAPSGLTGAASRVARAPVVELGSPGPSSATRPIPTGPSSLAYVMYTSGSTGRPKGVEIEHRGVLRYVRGARDLVPDPGESMLHVGQIGFDASTYEVWGALCNGARLVVYPGARFDPSRVAATIGAHGADVAMFTAGALHLMVDAQPDALGRLRLILAAGDVLSPGHARRLLAAHPRTRLVNAYGPTETSVTASVYDVTRVEPGRSIPIGRPLANTTLHVLGDDLAPVPAGEVGELCVGGVGVARGYHRLADRTAERFVSDPFEVGGRLYRTGDRVRLLPGGDLEFLGRRDDQVKIRGYRVEPAEVAAALSGHPDVSSVEVVAAPGPRGRPRLIAFVVASRRGIADDLIQLARQRLPDYLVPTEVVEVDALPLTATGKVDRGALVDGVRRHAVEPPRTTAEALVAAAVARALDLDGVGAHDDFFDLGGDSLAALQVLVSLEENAGASLGLADVFEARTVERLALRVDALAGAARRLPVLEVAPDSRGSPASVTQAQACFLAELALPNLPYQSSAVLELTGDLDVGALERAAQAVVDRHDVLRTAIPKVGGGWVLRALDGAVAPFEVVDLRDDPDPVASFSSLLDDRLHRRIDLEVAPLVRWTLARLRDDHARLIQVEHHAVHDGWSFARVVGDLLGAYRAYSEGGDPAWAPAPRYRDFAHWQRCLPGTEVGRAQLDYWRSVLDGAAPPASIGRRLTPGATFAGGTIRRDLPAELVDAVRATARRAGATAFQVMLTAFLTLVGRLSGESDVVVGSGFANRRLAGVDELVGMVVNTVAIRANLANDLPVADALDVVRRAVLGAYDHQEIPFEEVVRHLAPTRRAGKSPYFDHLFSLHDTPIPVDAGPRLDVVVRDTLANGSAKADLNVIVVDERGRGADPGAPDERGLTVVWEYSREAFDAASAAAALDAYVTLLRHLVEGDGQRLGDLELTEPDAREALVRSAVAPYERDSSIPSVFAERVSERPDATAVSAVDGEATYREVSLAAGRVARGLAAATEPGARVGVLDDRTRAMVAAILGTLEAGRSYVGLDAALPAARLAQMVEDASIAIVLSGSPVPESWAGVAPRVVELAPDGAGLGDGGARDTAAPRWYDPAYVSFTSGSTGRPKGVAASHRGVLRLVRGANYASLEPEDVVLGGSPLAFDASTFEVFGALLNGARLVLVEPGPHAPFELADVIADQGVTTAFFTTALFHQIVDHAPAALAPLRQLLVGGEVLSPARVARARASLDPRAALVAVYGPTENTTFTTYYPVRAGDLVEGPVALGRPVSNTTVAVVDAAGRLLPDGLAGQLVAGGDGVALGYVGRPDLTAERFVANDLDVRLGERLYRTGDWARWRADGQLEFLGRSDRQVKIRGFRVEPAELEAALVGHPDVTDAFVTVVEFGPDDRRLVAYVVGASDALNDAGLREHLSARLPRAFQPAAIVRLDALPLRANGKVDPARLPPPPGRWFAQGLDDPSAPESTLGERPRGADALEATVLAVFQEVTGVRDVGPDDDFFDLGGHSLMAVELVAALERTTGGRLALRALFDAPTPAGISAILRGEGVRPHEGSLVALTTSGSRPPFFAITAGDGNVVGFGPLARRLGPDQPFYALQPRGLDGEEEPHTSVESMAREYVDLIRGVQPAGPYLLGGRCFGAVVGYEVARVLERAGETVAVLVSIDSGGPDWTTRRIANGRAYDVAMNAARVRSRAMGVDHGDVFADREAADAFVAWLAEPAAEHEGVVVTRYLYSAYLARPDLREAYPLDDEGGADLGHAGLNAWAWTSGRSEFDLQEDMLGEPPRGVDLASPPPPADAPAERSGADPVSRVLRAAEGAARRYRAGPLRAPVVLIHATRGPHSLPWLEAGKWYGVEAGAVEDLVVEGTHHGILREPAVARLADEVAVTIDRALAGLPRDG